MAAPQKDINLLPREEWEKKPLGRLVKWALNIGRYIVITTELLVIIAFISRFKIDRDLAQVYEEIKTKQERLEALADFEKDFRATQNNLKIIQEIEDRKSHLEKVIPKLAALVPPEVVLESTDIKEVSIEMKAYAFTAQGIATFINNLQKSAYFQEMEVGNISQKEETEISFDVKAKLNPQNGY